MTLLLSDHVRQLSYFAKALAECIGDTRDDQSGVAIYYNMDFGLLAPLLFDRASQGSKPFLTSAVSGMRRVLSEAGHDTPYKLVISGATVYEFFDQLEHMLVDIQQTIPELPTKYRIKDEEILRATLKTSAQIRSELGILTRKGLDEKVRMPINKLLALLDSGALHGIGDFLAPDFIRAKTEKAQFEQFVAQQRARRLSLDRGRRSVEDSMFHYKIDAANNCLALAARTIDNVSAPFVTPTPLNVQQCTLGEQVYARLERTPLFLLNADRFQKHIGDRVKFLRVAAREALELVQELEPRTTLEECPPYTLLRLAKFYEGSIALLNKGAREDDTLISDEHTDEILNTLSDPSRIARVVEEAVEDIRLGAKLVELHSTDFDLPYVDQFDFGSDPVLTRIKKDLGVRGSQ